MRARSVFVYVFGSPPPIDNPNVTKAATPSRPPSLALIPLHRIPHRLVPLVSPTSCSSQRSSYSASSPSPEYGPSQRRPSVTLAMNGYVSSLALWRQVKEVLPLNVLAVSCRIGILWAKILARLVPCWMHCVVVLVGRLVVDIFPVASEDFCLLPVAYIYPQLNASQHYLPPRVDHLGDLECDCNTVMYKYEVQTPRRGSRTDFLFGLESLHGVCLVSGGTDLPVRPRTAVSLRHLLTTPSTYLD